MNIVFNYYTISLLLGGFMAFFSGLVVFLNDRDKAENQAWFAMTASTSVWSFGYFFMTISPNKDSAILANQILHYAAIFIPLFYFLLVLIVTKSYDRYKNIFISFCILAIGFEIITPSTLFVSDLIPKVGFKFAQVPGPLYILYFLYFSILVLFGIIVSAIAIKSAGSDVQKNRYKYIIYFTLAASLGGGSVFATTFLDIPPYPLILFSIYPVITGYAILRHQLFDIKIIATQLITFILWISILVRIFFAQGIREQVGNGILLAISIVLGFLLIKTAKSEVKQREKIQALATSLESANVKLQELDQQKSEFVSLASHQLRGPLTAIKGYGSMILDGDFGEVSPEVKEAVDKIYRSTNDLVVLVGDYLNVSRIEQGRMEYDFTTFDLRELVGTVVSELKPNVEAAKLIMTFDYDANKTFNVHADKGKIKQIIGNFLDNSIKYTPKGSIHVWITRGADNKVLVTVTDTGVGIRPEVLPNLFAKFTRAPDASKTNIMGTGLGLYVAKKMIEAHHGRVWAESAGQDKGSSFYIELEGSL